MSNWSASISRGSKIGSAVLWTAAGVVMLAVHVGAGAWMMQEEPIVASDNAPPAAIMIELADVAEAVSTEETNISPDEVTSDQSVPAEQVESEVTPTEQATETPPEPVERVAEEVVEEVETAEPETAEPVETETVETAAVEEQVDPVVEEEDPLIDESSVTLPDVVEVPILSRPPPPRPTEVAEKPAPKKQEQAKKEPAKRAQQRQQAANATTQAQAQVNESNRNAARQSASGLSSSVSPARWASRVMAHLERRKRYPAGARSRGERGTVHVRFRIDDSGNVLSVSLAGSSGFPELDAEVLALVRRASPVPAPPPGANKTIMAPVRFSPRR